MKPRASSGPSLFDAATRRSQPEPPVPLAERMRPSTLEGVVGQQHLLGEGKFLARILRQDRLPSMIFWGTPGCGKTTLARVIAQHTRAHFVALSAVLSGVAELRQVVQKAAEARTFRGEQTLLFVDEIHRFHKGQQDALLPHVEQGTITLIGATTENPSFAVNAALLSRCKVFHLEPLPEASLKEMLLRAMVDTEHGLGASSVQTLTDEALEMLVRVADGDARRALNILENSVSFTETLDPPVTELGTEQLQASLAERTLRYDKKGEEHYNISSAFIKSMRGGDPDAALYWMFRMLDAGDDPLFISRRMMIFASEDIGNADPKALEVAVAADEAFRRMGLPEGAYPLSHACLYLACAPKSDGVKQAMARVRSAIEQHGALGVPRKLRNAPTSLMKRDGYGQNYRYAHDFAEHFVPGETYLPDEIVGQRFYTPPEQGYERTLRERLARWRGAASGSGDKG
jgi:putative ATPase